MQMQHQGSSSSSASGLGAMAWAFRDQKGMGTVRYPMRYGRAVAGAAGQAGRQAVVAAWGSVSGAFLTSGSALWDWARGWGVGSMGMLKPLASSRAASSVSCGQSKEVQLTAPGPGPATPRPVFMCSVALASQPLFLYLLPVGADTPSQWAKGQVWVTGTVGPQLEQELHSD